MATNHGLAGVWVCVCCSIRRHSPSLIFPFFTDNGGHLLSMISDPKISFLARFIPLCI